MPDPTCRSAHARIFSDPTCWSVHACIMPDPTCRSAHARIFSDPTCRSVHARSISDHISWSVHVSGTLRIFLLANSTLMRCPCMSKPPCPSFGNARHTHNGQNIPRCSPPFIDVAWHFYLIFASFTVHLEVLSIMGLDRNACFIWLRQFRRLPKLF